MDFWVVAAAAGAGYLAKYLSREREGEDLSKSVSGGSTHDKSESQSLLQQLRERACPLQRLSRRQLGENATSGREDISSNSHLRLSEENGAGASATEMASTSWFDDQASVNLRGCEECNILSLSSLPMGFPGKNNHQEKVDEIKRTSEVCEKSGDFLSSEPSTGEEGFYNRYGKSKSFLRSRRPHMYSIKPLSSLEGSLISQLYKEPVGLDEYVLTQLSSPTAPTVRPLFVTDGKQIISRASNDSYKVQFEIVENMENKGAEAYAEGEAVLGVPPLPKRGSVQHPKKLKQTREKGCLERSSSSNVRVGPKKIQSQGSPTGMLLFYIGIAIGVVSTVMANKREVDRLNELLKQTENFIEDLHEELEMKDSLTVQELANEGYESQENNDFSIHHQPSALFFPQQELTESTNCDNKEPYDQKEDDKSETMSKIEAELEAELERLELSMCSSSVQGRLSSLLELDPNFEADIVSGTSSTSTHTANYAVSPRELSLRLHEVIQARLQERIMELETAIQQSRQRMHLSTSEGVNSQRDFSNSEIGSSSTHESLTKREDSNNIARPLVLNLSGEAVDAYDDAYEEFIRVTEPEDENPPTTVSNKNNLHGEALDLLNQSQFYHQNRSGQNGSLTHLKAFEERQSKSQGSSELGDSEDEDDEMGKLLIQQIVEKTKQGSPALLNVQKMLFSMD